MSSSSTIPQQLFSGDFTATFEALLSQERFEQLSRKHWPRGAGKPKLSVWQWVMARVYHELARVGSFSASVRKLTRVKISDAALSQRACSIGMNTLEAILPEVLQPLADQQADPQAFYHGYRLVALDGTRFNLRNTTANNSQATKTRCSRGTGEPAFAHLSAVVLVELGLHQPLGAACGWQGEGELTLARRLFERTGLPDQSLLIGDRLFGTPSLLWEQADMLNRSSSALLVRVRSNLNAKLIKTLPDGSRMVEVQVRDTQDRHLLGTLEVREIHAKLDFEGSTKALEVRFWTTLLDAEQHPAQQLVELYAMRWEQELFFRELKSHMHRKANLLDGQTPETAGQEFYAMLLAASLIAQQRKRIAGQAGVAVLRVSFAKVLYQVAGLSELLAYAADLMPPEKIKVLVERVMDDLMHTALIPRRKPRSCSRTLRQPVKDWPKTKSSNSKPLIKKVTISNP